MGAVSSRYLRLLPVVLSLPPVLWLWWQARGLGQPMVGNWFDYGHWTLAYSAAALCALWAWHQASPARRRAQGAYALALLLPTLGQWVSNAALLLGNHLVLEWVADFLFCLMGPAVYVGTLWFCQPWLPAKKGRAWNHDVMTLVSVAALLVLTLYVPRVAGGFHWLSALLWAGAPVLLSAACVHLGLLTLQARLRFQFAWLAFISLLALHAVVWVLWVLEARGFTRVPGTWLDLAFSLTVLGLGGVVTLLNPQQDRSPGHERLCEALLRPLPILLLALAALTAGVVSWSPGPPSFWRATVIAASLTLLLLVSSRQMNLLRERESLRRARMRDALTGLANVESLMAELESSLQQALRSKQELALLSLNVDRFQAVNLLLGPGLGDSLLQQLARRLSAVLPPSALLARRGADEFLLLLPAASGVMQATQVVERMVNALHHSFSLGSESVTATLSVGVALAPADGRNADELMRASATALSRAKQQGGNQHCFFDATHDALARRRLRIAQSLSLAIERQELSLVYQPQCDLLSGRVIGAEALMRWNSGELGPVSPSQFIPIAEEADQINELGDWALQEVCRQQAAWREAGLPAVPVAVNVSVLQLMQSGLDRRVAALLAQHGLTPNALELEVTESMQTQEQAALSQALGQLRALGLSLAIDDFGTGYSSLSYLWRLAVQKLKLDKSFVDEALEQPGAEAIVRAVVQMAQALGMKVLAEGLETEAQRQLLIDCGCTLAQGHLLAPPLTPAEFESFVRQQGIELS